MSDVIQVIAHVRKHGAQGVFYPREFSVDLRCSKCGYSQADQDVNGDHRLCSGSIPAASDYKDAWFAQYGGAWELQHFVTLRPFQHKF